ncbi:MFS general substrate transporter [Mytilinidion resinicola]|uniref:MFS general substrate transporter n=1 Tax=Mytilinidion resinicola TaxID=574789 RepID=A0A6A6Z4Y7_9PEZI|nr:MFS general substrate transporter [Mytilinidion resinicola]KAF2815888.1 MFS general substrate transporter [Mytilinidion resinicola]
MTPRRLPVRQLVILSICRFAEPIALTSVFPYLPEMIESFGVAQNDIARWAGLTSSVFSACQCVTGIPWGAASDRFGRKTVILIGLCNTMICMLIWGFSTSLPMAFAARALQGAGNGNVGILRTVVAELCPWRELQPRAFSIMPLVYTLGAIIGPMIGGALSNPLQTDPRKPRGTKFLEKYPYALPNLIAAVLFLTGILTGFLFLQETLESKKNQRDIGIVLGKKLTAYFRRVVRTLTRKENTDREREPLLNKKSPGPATRPIDDEESFAANLTSTVQAPKPTYKDVLTTQTSLNLLVYALLALYSIAFDQLIPVFLHHPVQDLNGPDVALPFKFASGYGVGSRETGLLFTVYSVGASASQLLLFPPLARKLGVLHCLRIAFLVFPLIFLLTPFTALLPTNGSRFVVMAVLMIMRGMAGTFAFPTSTILLTNSASSLRTLGTLNGIATSASAIGRAFGPAIGGGMFTFGVKHGYIITPFWILGAISLLAAIPTFFLIEGKGFANDEEVDSDDSDAILTSDDEADKSDEEVLEAESEYGEPGNLLSHTASRTSTALNTDDESSDDEDERIARIRSTSMSHPPRRRSLRRRSSVPIGMGVGFRRYSSNLGSTGLPEGSWGG